MNERQTDFTQLRAFARHGDQPAFADVVRRHLDLVYATALRKVDDSGAAEEVAQNVFTTLARKAWQFAPDDSLPAWLYKTTLLEAREWLRGELRRRRREQTAAELGTTMKTTEETQALRALVPLLDDALLSLREKDRTALLLRFYERQSLRDVGASLGVSEDTAQKRVGSALEKLAQFFQRRGFRTATVAAATAALQHTAASAPAIVAASIAQAALKLAPPALGGLAGLLSRIAGLTKVQTAVLCAVIAIAPVAWQWNEERQTAAAANRLKVQLAASQSEYVTLRQDLERLRLTEARLEGSLADAASAAQRNSTAAKEFEDWKNRVRARLMASDYHWPDDSPFVRIPKSVVRQLNVYRLITPPGILDPAARELFGLSPAERERVEGLLHDHFSALDNLIETRIYETNNASRFRPPAGAVASEVFVLPALGDEMNTLASRLRSGMKEALGDERWSLVEPQFGVFGTHTLRRVLNLDAGSEPQEIGLWIQQAGDGPPTAGLQWGIQNARFSSDGLALNLFLPGDNSAAAANARYQVRYNDFPEAMNRRVLDWFQSQAVAFAGREAK